MASPAPPTNHDDQRSERRPCASSGCRSGSADWRSTTWLRRPAALAVDGNVASRETVHHPEGGATACAAFSSGRSRRRSVGGRRGRPAARRTQPLSVSTLQTEEVRPIHDLDRTGDHSVTSPLYVTIHRRGNLVSARRGRPRSERSSAGSRRRRTGFQGPSEALHPVDHLLDGTDEDERRAVEQPGGRP